MQKRANNFAYIGGANLYNGSKSLGWKMEAVFSSNINKQFSVLIKRTSAPIAYLSNLKSELEYKRKNPPIETYLYQGSFRDDII